MCPSWGEWSGIDPIFIEAGVKINELRMLPWGAADSKATACHAWDLWRVPYLPARQCSCSPSTYGQSAFWNETPAFILPDLLPPISTDLNPIDCKIWEKCSSGSSKFSSWRRWTEAALDRCLASFQAKHQRWRSWWEAQVLLRVNLCERKTVFLHLIQLQ